MFGSGLITGLGITLKRFVDTYVDDVKKIPSRYAYGHDTIRQTPEETGIFTIQYPEEKRELPERFRYIPMLLYDTPKEEDRCTACGICAKVCPTQCIWIVRDTDANGKPIPRPGEFYIDASICMSCGFCAEYCPFDAIKMNHDYELAVYDRYPTLVYNKTELTVPLEYYASLYPTQFVEEEARRAEEEAKKAAKQAAKSGGKPAAKEAPAAAKPAPAAEKPAPAPAKPAAAKPALAADNIFARLPNPAKTSGGYTAEEIAKRRVVAYERYKERKGPDAKVLHGAEAVASGAMAAAAPAAVIETPMAEAIAEASAPIAPAAPVAAPPAAASAAASPFHRLPNPAKTSGGYTADEIAERRRQAYERYRARKGADAKTIH
ncbi:MAG: NADH-quinone oxidoreductase subunit I [Caldilineales bacterium]